MANGAEVFSLVILALAASISSVRAAASVNLAWDSSPDPNVVGYFLYFGSASGSYSQHFNVGNVTAATIMGLTPGTTNYFAVTAYDSQGTESPTSNEVGYIVPGTLRAGLQSDNTFHLLFPVANGHSFDLQYSDTLSNWANLTTIFGQTNNIYDFVDTNFTSVPLRFYRLILH